MQLVLEREPPDHPLQGGDARLVLRQQVGRFHLVVELAALILLDPDTDQVTADVIALGQTLKADLTGQELLGDLPLERDRVCAMPCHGPSSWPSQHGQTVQPNLSTPWGSLQGTGVDGSVTFAGMSVAEAQSRSASIVDTGRDGVSYLYMHFNS